jgi:hypothetical protein
MLAEAPVHPAIPPATSDGPNASTAVVGSEWQTFLSTGEFRFAFTLYL